MNITTSVAQGLLDIALAAVLELHPHALLAVSGKRRARAQAHGQAERKRPSQSALLHR